MYTHAFTVPCGESEVTGILDAVYKAVRPGRRPVCFQFYRNTLGKGCPESQDECGDQ